MAVMTVQPPLPLVPGDARPVGAAAAIVEDGDGGRVFVHGNLAYAWDAGDTAARRFAAVSLMRIKAATQLEVAEAFAVKPASVRRWETWLTDSGVAGLLGERKGPKRKSKLIADTVAAHPASARRWSVLPRHRRRNRCVGGQRPQRAAYWPMTAPVPRKRARQRRPMLLPNPSPSPRVSPRLRRIALQRFPMIRPVPVQVPVLADPVDRGAERALAAFGLIPYAPPVFTGCARAPLAGLLLALPALAATGLLDTAHTVYGELPQRVLLAGHDVVRERVPRPAGGGPRRGRRPDRPARAGPGAGVGPGPGGQDDPPQDRLLAGAGGPATGSPRWRRRHVAGPPRAGGGAAMSTGMSAPMQGTRRIAKTHVPRLKFPAPATVETWVADAAGDPLLVVMAEPGASLAGELRRLIPELRALVGDDRRVLVGFDRGGWSPTLFADLHAAGFDTLTWRKGAIADLEQHQFIEHTHTDEHGRTHTWALADTEVELDIADGPRAGEVFAMRQISLFNPAATRQMHILTTRTDLTPGEVRYRMGSRWRQENHYRYARMHFDLDSHDTYRAGDDDPTGWCPTRPRNPPTARSKRPGGHCISAETASDAALLAAHSPQPGTSVVLTNDDDQHHQRRRPHRRAAHSTTALAAHQAIPARLPLVAGPPRPAGPRHRNQTDPPRHPHRRVQHRTIPGACDRHRHRLHPRRRRSPHPDPHRPGRLRRHHPRRRHPAHPPRPAAPRHATPPPSTNSAKPSTTPTPSTPAPTSRCATASNPTDDRTPITELCQESWCGRAVSSEETPGWCRPSDRR